MTISCSGTGKSTSQWVSVPIPYIVYQADLSLGNTLMRRYRNAIRDRNLQVEGHRGLTASLSATLVEKWEKLCIEWEKKPWPKKKPSPFRTEDVFLSEAQVRKEL